MSKYRKKATIVIEAEEFRPDSKPLPFRDSHVCFLGADGAWYLFTKEGPLRISNGDWVIKGVHGEFYPIKPDIFEETYEVAGE